MFRKVTTRGNRFNHHRAYSDETLRTLQSDRDAREAMAVEAAMSTLARDGSKLSRLALSLDVPWLAEIGSELINLAGELEAKHHPDHPGHNANPSAEGGMHTRTTP